MKDSDKKTDFLDRAENIRKLWISLYGVCGLLVVVDFFLPVKGHFGFDGFFGFYSLLGFVSCAVLILLSKVAGFVLKVPEDYYE
ncbi:MAG: hypothetical protein RDU20_06550 [Desulfomonilaceae bacterium]|nr:hypothetical protein [Desulfomonilaceae bacterium]